jgi:hypothetical protein
MHCRTEGRVNAERSGRVGTVVCCREAMENGDGGGGRVGLNGMEDQGRKNRREGRRTERMGRTHGQTHGGRKKS